MQLYFNPRTDQALHGLAKNLPHAIGIYGEIGSGLRVAAQELLSLSGIKQPYLIYPEKDGVIDRLNGTITIEMIRNLYKLTDGKNSRHRAFVLIGAERLSTAAANAFLKLLEEPTEGVTFVLTSSSAGSILPTIRSRLQEVTVLPIDRQQSAELINELGVANQTKHSQLLFMASGRPSLLTKLANDDDYFQKESSSLRLARDYISGSVYQRLTIAQKLHGSKADALRLVNYAMTLLMFNTDTKKRLTMAERQLLIRLEQAAQYISINGNPRLALAAAAVDNAN